MEDNGIPESGHEDSAVRNLDICRTWIQDQVEEIREEHALASAGEAFLGLVAGLLFDLDYDALPPEEIVDGGQDKQIDIIRIEDDEERGYAEIHIIQAKNATGFSSQVLVQMRNGLAWVFERQKSEYDSLSNRAFANQIDQIRQLRLAYGQSNIAVSVYYVTAGDSGNLSAEYLQERKVLVDRYSNVGFADFRFREIGAFELVDILTDTERSHRKIDLDISIVYDVNRPSLIEYTAGDKRALICTVTGEELARLVSTRPRDAVFDLNVRPFYGSRGRVNRDILDTCTSEDAAVFWFLNNGITMTCDHYDLVPDPDNPVLKVQNAQIVNGCQTSVTIREAFEKKQLKKGVKVLLRVYATQDASLVERITLTTNNQNNITDRDLKANDKIQLDVQRIISEKYGYYYERKNKQYRALRGEQKRRIIPNVRAAQAYLAIVRRKPSLARGHPGKIWSDYYAEIFGNATADDLVACFLILRYCQNRAKIARDNESLDRIHSEVSVYGVFHLARLCGYLLTDDDWGSKNSQRVRELVRQLQASAELLSASYDEAFGVLLQVRKQALKDHPNPTLYFKAGDAQRAVETTLRELPRPR